MDTSTIITMCTITNIPASSYYSITATMLTITSTITIIAITLAAVRLFSFKANIISTASIKGIWLSLLLFAAT